MISMETIKIPGVPVNASRIGLGTWAIGGWMWGGTEESAAAKVSAVRSNASSGPGTRRRKNASTVAKYLS